jgi:hypothetical protein
MKLKGTFVFNLEPLGPFKFVSKPYILALALTPLEIPEAERKLIAWWKLDETEGNNAADSSGNNNTGTLIGGPQWQPAGGKVGGAVAFDGVDDYIECGINPSINLTGGVSVSSWIKFMRHAKDRKIASNQDNTSGGYKLGVYDDKIEMEIRDSGNSPSTNRFIDGGAVLEPDVWYHVVGTYSQGGSIKTYVNGKLDRESETPAMLAPSGGALKIGREPFSNLYWFDGLIDDLRIYNYPLSQAEITALYSGETLPVAAQKEVLATAEEEPGKGSNWIPVLVIVIIVAAAAALAVRRKKTTT